MSSISNDMNKSSIARKNVAIKKFVLWALDNKYIEVDFASRIHVPKFENKLPEVMNEKVLLSMLESIKKNFVDLTENISLPIDKSKYADKTAQVLYLGRLGLF